MTPGSPQTSISSYDRRPGLIRARTALGHLVRPLPRLNVGVIDAMLVSIIPALNLEIAEFLFCVSSDSLQLWNAVNRINGQAEAIDLVLDGQIERRVDVSFFLVAANVHVVMVRTPISQAMDQPRVAVEGEDDGCLE